METYKLILSDGTEILLKSAEGIGRAVCEAESREAALEIAGKITANNLLQVQFAKDVQEEGQQKAERLVFGSYSELRGSVTIPDTDEGACELIISLREKSVEDRVSNLESAVGTMAMSMLG